MSGSEAAAEPASVSFDGRQFARTLPATPGVYRMIDAAGDVLYVGKANALDKRVGSYFSSREQSRRIASMLQRVARMEVTLTRTEGEALILENQLIKSLRPRYNVLLRDDKSYPYLRFSDAEYPRVAFYRGSRSVGGRVFGPYPGVVAVRETLNLLYKLFRLRSCEDSVFSGRSRPCLQYQIARCSGPCVGLVSRDNYAESLRQAGLFLEGRSDALLTDLDRRMLAAAGELQFEEAARLRDMIAGIRKVQAEQHVEGDQQDLDVIACALEDSHACVLVLSFRNGVNLGTRSYFPRLGDEREAAPVIAAFLTQHYLGFPPPREIVIDRAVPDQALIEAVLSEQNGRRVTIKHAVRSERARLLDIARRTAQASLASEVGSSAMQQKRVADLAALLGLTQPPSRIECFDISHTQGEATVASCVVFSAEGPQRSQYRRFNISGIEPGDDYAAMEQALRRRFRADKSDRVLPDLLLIDGGSGQLGVARRVLAELELADLPVLGVAKGEQRKAGLETLILPDGRELRPGGASLGLQLIQQVRDEAHRFAITGHRGRRAKARMQSTLEAVEGIGARRRAALLRHFGGLAGVRAAGVEELTRVDGINAPLARRIYAALHGSDETPGAGREQDGGTSG